MGHNDDMRYQCQCSSLDLHHRCARWKGKLLYLNFFHLHISDYILIFHQIYSFQRYLATETLEITSQPMQEESQLRYSYTPVIDQNKSNNSDDIFCKMLNGVL